MSHYDPMIKGIFEFVENHIHEPLNLDIVAAHSTFSKYHFHRIFRTSVGMSVKEYIRLRRLANASSALLYSDARILDIGLNYQFETQESFTKAFKEVYKLPPGKYRKMMTTIIKNMEGNDMKTTIQGWFLSGGNPYNYEMGIDHEVVHQGKGSAFLKSKTVLDTEEFATMMQQCKAKIFRNKRIKFSGFIRTQDVENVASLWMRIDNATGDILQFDNMSDRPIKGTTNWNRYSVVLDVPEEGSVLSFGVILAGKGTMWADHFSFEEVNEDTPTTNIEIHGELQDEPVNLSFDEAIG